MLEKKTIQIKHNIFNNKKTLKHKYFLPIVGIFYCWQKFFENKRVCYLNYLPLWNFLLFLLLPPKTIFGPITGGAVPESGYQRIIRLSIFPILYKISQICLLFRKTKIIFATDLLKKYCFNLILKKSFWNYQIKKILLKKKYLKKNIDLLIYYRKHSNKKTTLLREVLEKVQKKKRILVVGDNLNNPKVKNLGFKSNKEIQAMLRKTKYSIISSENIFSFYTMECINSNVLIIYKKKPSLKIKFLKKYFIEINEINFKNKLLLNNKYLNKQKDILKSKNDKCKLFFKSL